MWAVWGERLDIDVCCGGFDDSGTGGLVAKSPRCVLITVSTSNLVIGR